MRVIFLLCAAFAVSVTTANPVTEMTSEPVEEPVPVQKNTTGEERRGELQPRAAGRMAKWQYGGFTPSPHYYREGNGCPSNWHSLGSRCFVFIDSPMAWIDAEKQCWSYGANLASIHEQWEYNFIWNYVLDGYYGQAWIGGTDAVRPMDSLWSDGSVFDAKSWVTRRPNNWERWKNCLTIDRQEYGTLIKRYCEDMLPFVCGTRPDRLF